MKVSSVFILLALATGCTSLSPAGEKVRVTDNPDVVRGCQFVGNVKAVSGWGGSAGGNIGENEVEKTLQNRTADLGGDTLYVRRERVDAGTTRGSGEAYRCSEHP